MPPKKKQEQDDGKKTKKHEQCGEIVPSEKRARRCIADGHATVCFMRGVSGSGKTFLAETLTRDHEDYEICSLESVRERDRAGTIDEEEEQALLSKMMKKLKELAVKGCKLIIVDYDNISTDQIAKFIKNTELSKMSYEIYVLEPPTVWKHKAEECARRSRSGQSAENLAEKIKIIQSDVADSTKLLEPDRKLIVNPYYAISDEEDNAQKSDELNNEESSENEEGTSFIPASFSFMIDKKQLRDVGTFAQIDEDVEIGEIRMIEPRNGKQKKESSTNTFDSATKKTAKTPVLSHGLESARSLHSKFQCVPFHIIRHLYDLFGYNGAYRKLARKWAPVHFENFDEEHLREITKRADMEECEVVDVPVFDADNNMQNAQLLFTLFTFQPAAETPSRDTTASDAEIARALQEEEAAAAKERRKEWSTSDEQNVQNLYLAFPGLNHTKIDDIYNLTRKDVNMKGRTLYDAAHETVRLVHLNNSRPVTTEGAKTSLPKSSSSQSVASSSREGQVIDISGYKEDNKPSHSEAVMKVIRLREECEKNLSASTQPKNAEAARALRESNNKKRTAVLNQCDAILEEAHSDWRRIDLHYMTREGALRFVEKVYKETRRGQSFVVITGKGNHSQNGCVLKRAINYWIRENNISSKPGDDDGSVIITKKY